MEELALVGLLLIVVPFVLPVVSWVRVGRLRRELEDATRLLADQRNTIDGLARRVNELERVRLVSERQQSAPTTPAASTPAAAPSIVSGESKPAADRLVTPPAPPARAVRPVASTPPIASSPPSQPIASPHPARAAAASAPTTGRAIGHASLPPPPLPPRREVAASGPPPQPPGFAFDWEQFVGVRLFSAVAGIALVIAGVFFLRYSIERGWLQPAVRVMIGVITGIGLLVVCERKAARRYPVTANALDAAAIAILFSTFFSAYALWKLIPAGAAFALLAAVTATAVLLSIRRASLFIAVLGLLGGFATPALLSTGENRPIGLFSYLMLLNIGLAWVAYRQRWPALTALTLVFTTIYQWAWVVKFLDGAQLPIATGIFVAFAATSFAALALSGRSRPGQDQAPAFERTALLASALPLLFAVYFAAVPQYRDHFWLLFGFLFLVDAGLFAIALARDEHTLHSTAAVVTVVTFVTWLAMSYTSAAWPFVLGIVAAFIVFYLLAPAAAARLARRLDDRGRYATHAAPLLLLAFVVLVRLEAQAVSVVTIFAPLLALLLLIAWRAIASSLGPMYFVAAFLALATEAVWSQQFLAVGRLGAAVVVYAAFGVAFLAVPIVARRAGRPLAPKAGSGVLLLSSLGLLLFLTTGTVAPQALWAFALLLAILNAALFIESAATSLPLLSIVGSLASWGLLALWWSRAGAAAGVNASLLVVVGFVLLMCGGYAWTRKRLGGPSLAQFGGAYGGLYLALIAHVFLCAFAADARWAVPPWPLFGALAVISMAVLTTALAFGEGRLHIATFASAALVLLTFATTIGPAPWPTVALAGFAAIAAASLLWLPLARRRAFAVEAAVGSAVVLAIGIIGAVVADQQPASPRAMWIVLWHVAALSTLLALTARHRWARVAVAAALLAAVVVAWWSGRHPAAVEWPALLALASAIFAVFAAYPMLLGTRSRGERDPYVAAIVASAWFLLAARHALILGGYESIVGIVPVVLGAVMAMLLRQLLHLEPPGNRDLGRLALVAAASLAFVTVAIPMQLQHQWITIGWALEGAAMAWLFSRIPHRGLFYGAAALLTVAFVRLAANPAIFRYQLRGSTRIVNWYLYAYAVTAAAMFAAAWWFSRTDDHLIDRRLRVSWAAASGAVVLLFLLLNIEIADFYASGPEIAFRFGTTIAQDLTYTIGWLVFGLALLAGGILLETQAARASAVVLIATTALKCFLYDLGSLDGLYRVAAFVGLAISLTLVSLALQKFVLLPRREPA